VSVQVRRIYDPPSPADGVRVLVDGSWPGGLSRRQARLDGWCQALAPSTEVGRWYGRRPERWSGFAHGYRNELARPQVADNLEDLRALAADRPVTLLTAEQDVDRSAAAVLADVLVEGG
jgi:uncharacterized protein YeaO (DUF488 family)